MIFILFLLGLFCLFGSLFAWLAWRWSRKLFFWLLWMYGGLAMLFAIHPHPGPLSKVLVQAWAWSVVLLPVWWLLRWVFGGSAPPPRPPDNFADLKPIKDESGRQIYP